MMSAAKVSTFDIEAFLSHSGLGRRLMDVKAKRPLFVQGEPGHAIYYLQKGRARLLVTSKRGKEATLAILGPGDFMGQEAIASQAPIYMSTGETITACSILKIDRAEAMRVIHEEHSFSDLFIAYMVSRSMRVQADLVDQLFNSSEKRLARTLLSVGTVWSVRRPESRNPENKPGDPRGNGWHDPLQGQLLYESLSKTRFH